MKILYKNIVWAIISLAIISFVFSFFFSSTPATENFNLNKLAEKINQNEVKKITLIGNNLNIEFKDGKIASTKKEVETSLSDTLKNYGVDPFALRNVELEVKDEPNSGFWLGVIIPSILPILIIGTIIFMTLRQAKSGAGQMFNFGRSNIKLFAPNKDRVTFKDVAGLKESKQELEEVVDFLKNPKKFLDLGAKIPRGVLLMGSPGTGKTLLARAVAGESGVPFFHISASEFVEMFVGVGASRTRDAFATAKRAAPSILFIDEIDAIGRERGTGVGGGHDEREQTLNQILVEMDGFEREARVVVIAATNRPDVLDAALLRPGRFDRRVMLDLPDLKDREEILKIHAKGKPLEQGINFKKIATRTPGFSGADLANLMNEAAILTARKNKKIVSEMDILESVEKVLLGPERKGRVISENEKSKTAYHEAGHALVAASLKDSDPVHKVSIISRGQAGGYTLKLPLEETHLKTKKQFLNDMAVMFGGYSAEELIFGEVSTGASSDLKNASRVAKAVVTKYGMSDLGPITFGKSQELIFMGKEMNTEKDYSEEVARKIDAEIFKLIDIAHETAKKILKSRKKVLDSIAKVLIEKETLEQDEFYDILKPFNLKPIAIMS